MKNRFQVQIFGIIQNILRNATNVFFNKWMQYALCFDTKTEQSTRGIIFYPYGREDNTCAYVTFQGTGDFVDVFKWRWEGCSG